MNEASLEISLGNELREIAGVAAQVDRFCADHRLMPGLAYAVNLAIDEILTNTISYGYEDRERHRIEVIVNLEADQLVVVIVDDSMPFDLGLAPERDLDLSIEDTALGGLGLYLVHQMMDRVDYRREAGCNIVTLVKGTGRHEDLNGTRAVRE
ncbi:MAG: ATP-binding protein [Spirochaetaceae bacterium]|nr:ATP-binding protein [Spirochaetaceae bacterium]